MQALNEAKISYRLGEFCGVEFLTLWDDEDTLISTFKSKVLVTRRLSVLRFDLHEPSSLEDLVKAIKQRR